MNAAMRTALITVTQYNTVEDAAQLMLKHKIGGLPIVADGKLVGMVTTSDLLKAVSGRRQGKPSASWTDENVQTRQERKTHDWISRRLELVPGRLLVKQTCRRWGRDFVGIEPRDALEGLNNPTY